MATQVFRGITYDVKTATGDGQTLQGTPLDDWLVALGGSNTIRAGKGNDVILAGVEFGSISDDYPPYGGAAIFYERLPSAGNNLIDAGSGDDYVVAGSGNDIIKLGSGNNIFDGNPGGNDQVFAGNGDDIIDTGNGNNVIDAGGGHNRIYLTAGNSFVSAGSGNDVVTTNEIGLGALDFYLCSTEGVTAQPYKQVINAGNGDNQIQLLVFGQTTITTGSGNDFVLTASINQGFFNAGVNLDSVDILTGYGNDTVITLSTKSLIRAGCGNDRIIAGRGDDSIFAGSGDDVINLRGEIISIPSPVNTVGFNAALFGVSELPVSGGGNDTVYLENGIDTVILGSTGFATIYGFGRNDKLDVNGLNATFTRQGQDTLISSGATSLGILRGYTGSVALI
jgi:Ca2+-binding RTX toxin-like protein